MIRGTFRLFATTATAVAALTMVGHATDGVIEINQARALAGFVTPGDTPGFPVTLSQSGSYRLTGSLDFPSNNSGISVTASYVTIDLNGFSIRGGTGYGAGISVESASVGSAVLNGTVILDHGDGISLRSDSRIEGVQVLSRTTQGGEWGLVVGSHSIVTRCIVSGFFFGIGASDGSVVSSNAVSATQVALSLSGGAGFVGNSLKAIQYVNGGGEGIQLGLNVCGTALCP